MHAGRGHRGQQQVAKCYAQSPTDAQPKGRRVTEGMAWHGEQELPDNVGCIRKKVNLEGLLILSCSKR